MVERILPIEEETEEDSKLVGLPDGEEVEGVSGGEEEEGEDISDMFESPSNQRYEREDISDLFEVTEEDVMGEEDEIGDDNISDLVEGGEEKEEPETPHWSDEDIKRYEQIQKKQAKKPVYRRTVKRYTPPSQIGGVE